MIDKPYQALRDILDAALEQASSGKGRERHANDEPFEEQQICSEARLLGLGAPVFQARKKAREAIRLAESGEYEKAMVDLLGAINYTAGAYRIVKEMQNEFFKSVETKHLEPDECVQEYRQDKEQKSQSAFQCMSHYYCSFQFKNANDTRLYCATTRECRYQAKVVGEE